MILQIDDANRVRTEAAAADVEKSNLFAWYQSKRLRQAQDENVAETLSFLTGADDARGKAIERLKARAKKYSEPDEKHESLPELIERGSAAGKKAESLTTQAAKIRDEAEHVHHQADRLDIAHLLAEVALVICSISLLTKKKGFWYAGMLLGVLALATTASAYAIPHQPHSHTEVSDHGHAH